MTGVIEAEERDQEILDDRHGRVADAIDAGYVDPEATDPEAPYGRRPDGRPYTMPPEKRQEIGQRLAAARAAAGTPAGGRRRRTKTPAAPRKTTGGAGSSPAAAVPDYRPTLSGLLVQLPSFALSMLGRTDPTFTADAAAVVVHGPALVEAVAETATQDARLARLLDRISAVGPYGLVVTAAMPLVFQILANHRVMPPNRELGVLPPDELLNRLPPAPAQAA